MIQGKTIAKGDTFVASLNFLSCMYLQRFDHFSNFAIIFSLQVHQRLLQEKITQLW